MSGPMRFVGAVAKSLVAVTAVAAPNVILVMADDLGRAQTGYYEHPILETPNLVCLCAAAVGIPGSGGGLPDARSPAKGRTSSVA